jgi:hypothetical protein
LIQSKRLGGDLDLAACFWGDFRNPAVTTTTASYLQVESNLARYQQMTANEPAVKTASAYYAANIGKVTSISQFVNNYRLLSYALNAYGLGDQINSKALITQVLQGGVTNPKALANTLNNSQWKAFAEAFNFVGKGAASISTSSAIQTTESNYVEQQLESDQGEQDPGVQLALYFQRVAPTVTNAYGILADKNLLEVVQTIFGLSPNANAADIDTEANEISKILPISELQNPATVKQLTERFTAMYDLEYGPTSGATSTLTVDGGNSSTTASAASTILSGVITSNGQSISSALTSASDGLTPLFSNAMLQSMQGFKLGG